jgi:hypothetical protein
MEDFKRQFINVAYSEFGIKAIERINFEQAFAILDKMQALRLNDVVGQSEQLPCDCGAQLKETTIQVFCPKCYKTWKIK